VIVRTYGAAGPIVIVLHGGPAAAGEAAPIARALGGSFRVLEPWQRGSGAERLTVSRHVADLHELLTAHRRDRAPALVGESWGAMLALVYAAEHPGDAGPLVLIGCGTFDVLARARLRSVLEERTDDRLRRRLEGLAVEFPDPAERIAKRHELTERLYLFDPAPPDPADADPPRIDVRAHTETWEDMLRLQAAGVYPAAFAAIRSPVLMLHGAYDPHPGGMIRGSLAPYLPQLEYHELERCGHSPWRERAARVEFFAVLRTWLSRHLAAES
jgi:pimeloyl-ACP methyl ester carboxylesterase